MMALLNGGGGGQPNGQAGDNNELNQLMKMMMQP
jgi:hypothetical protein